MDKPDTCGECKHWVESPRNPMALNERRGTCRHSPPAVGFFADQRGGMTTVSSYPDLPANFSACGQYSKRVALHVEGEPSVNGTGGRQGVSPGS